MELEIKHDTYNQNFFTILDSKEAYLKYIITGEKTINMIKTYVPPELRGKGIAAKVVQAGLLFAQKNNYKVIPTCSYVDTYIEQHPEFSDLLLTGY